MTTQCVTYAEIESTASNAHKGYYELADLAGSGHIYVMQATYYTVWLFFSQYQCTIEEQSSMAYCVTLSTQPAHEIKLIVQCTAMHVFHQTEKWHLIILYICLFEPLSSHSTFYPSSIQTHCSPSQNIIINIMPLTKIVSSFPFFSMCIICVYTFFSSSRMSRT